MEKNIYTQIITWFSLTIVIIILVLCIIYWNNENYQNLNPKDFFPENEANFSKKKSKNIANCPQCKFSYHNPIWRNNY